MSRLDHARLVPAYKPLGALASGGHPAMRVIEGSSARSTPGMAKPTSSFTAFLPFVLALTATVPGCDAAPSDDPVVARAEVENIETLTDGELVYQLVGVEGERRIVLEAQGEGRRLVAVADEAGGVLAIALIDVDGTRYLDADLAVAGELVGVAAGDFDPVSQIVLDHFVTDTGAFRRGLSAAPRHQAAIMSCLRCAWHHLFGNPDLMHPSCGDC